MKMELLPLIVILKFYCLLSCLHPSTGGSGETASLWVYVHVFVSGKQSATQATAARRVNNYSESASYRNSIEFKTLTLDSQIINIC